MNTLDSLEYGVVYLRVVQCEVHEDFDCCKYHRDAWLLESLIEQILRNQQKKRLDNNLKKPDCFLKF